MQTENYLDDENALKGKMKEQDQFLQLSNFLCAVTEIELRLKNTKLQLEDCEKWFDEAYGKYKAEVKYWGRDQADSGEYIAAGTEVELLKAKVSELEWVLGLLNNLQKIPR